MIVGASFLIHQVSAPQAAHVQFKRHLIDASEQTMSFFDWSGSTEVAVKRDHNGAITSLKLSGKQTKGSKELVVRFTETGLVKLVSWSKGTQKSPFDVRDAVLSFLKDLHYRRFPNSRVDSFFISLHNEGDSYWIRYISPLNQLDNDIYARVIQGKVFYLIDKDAYLRSARRTSAQSLNQ
jgi:hypothetical protein